MVNRGLEAVRRRRQNSGAVSGVCSPTNRLEIGAVNAGILGRSISLASAADDRMPP